MLLLPRLMRCSLIRIPPVRDVHIFCLRNIAFAEEILQGTINIPHALTCVLYSRLRFFFSLLRNYLPAEAVILVSEQTHGVGVNSPSTHAVVLGRKDSLLHTFQKESSPQPPRNYSFSIETDIA